MEETATAIHTKMSCIVYTLCQTKPSRSDDILRTVQYSVTYCDHWYNVGVCLCNLILVCLNFSCWGQTHRGLHVDISISINYVTLSTDMDDTKKASKWTLNGDCYVKIESFILELTL